MVRNGIDAKIGKLIREKRMARGINQETLGKAISVSFQQVQKIETGINRISAGNLKLVADYLKVDIAEFFDSSEDNFDSDYERERLSRVKKFLQLPNKVQLALLKMYEVITDNDK